MDSLLEPDAGIEKQLPRRAGDDERQRQRIEIDRAQNALAADLLIEQDRQGQAERETEDDVESAEMPMLTIAVYQLDGGSVSNVQVQSFS